VYYVHLASMQEHLELHHAPRATQESSHRETEQWPVLSVQLVPFSRRTGKLHATTAQLVPLSTQWDKLYVIRVRLVRMHHRMVH
jgi:hypothetical protein